MDQRWESMGADGARVGATLSSPPHRSQRLSLGAADLAVKKAQRRVDGAKRRHRVVAAKADEAEAVASLWEAEAEAEMTVAAERSQQKKMLGCGAACSSGQRLATEAAAERAASARARLVTVQAVVWAAKEQPRSPEEAAAAAAAALFGGGGGEQEAALGTLAEEAAAMAAAEATLAALSRRAGLGLSAGATNGECAAAEVCAVLPAAPRGNRRARAS